MHDMLKKKMIFNINMLKKWQASEETSCYALEMGGEEAESVQGRIYSYHRRRAAEQATQIRAA